ncbi:MAG TPA: hypothetical protein VEY09_01570 [Pyrinomonadaceae bacterium]|nr:hypothetical protein [Pyrinomonadaceae bacterium]
MRTATGKLAASALLILKLAGATLCVVAAVGHVVEAAGRDNPDAREARTAGAASPLMAAGFDEALDSALARRGAAGKVLCDKADAVSRRILREYGAVFLAGEQVLAPPVCIFSGPQEVALFQAEAQTRAATIKGTTVELQPAAMQALLAAREEALAAGLDITPRDGPEAARRDYADTLRLWNSRLLPALEHWRRRGALTAEESGRLRALPAHEQIGPVLELEGRGIFFSRDFSKSILHSVAAPGASQHLSLLAFDVCEYADERVRAILSRHGWFRTVRNDSPHFTYLGLPEKLLPSRGLKNLKTREGEFWVPNV